MKSSVFFRKLSNTSGLACVCIDKFCKFCEILNLSGGWAAAVMKLMNRTMQIQITDIPTSRRHLINLLYAFDAFRTTIDDRA